LANVVAGTAELDDCLMHLEEANIDVLTAGHDSSQSVGVAVIASLCRDYPWFERKYDRIVIDSPPSIAGQ
jgi:succinoglycan biosynthesis transport protein ExoP